jgi:WhiB family transcriptional regulator, redox-sensing transcriptional regulator
VHDHKRPAAAATQLRDSSVSVCARDPDRWTTTVDEGAKALCRACPLRWRCAKAACETPAAEGIWAGILIPETGRGRQFALRQLRSLAEQNGLFVRNPTTRTVGRSPGEQGSIAS